MLRLSDGGFGGTLEERSTAMPSGTLVGGTGAPELVTDYLDRPNQDAALDLLRRLNALADRDGHAFTGRVRYHGYEPWWFHQQAVFHRYLLPYTRYQHLITRLASADRIVADDCPPDLSTLLRLTLDSRCDLQLRESPRPRPIQRLRKRIAGSGYRVATLMAAALGRLRRPEAIVYAIDVLGRGRACDPRIERLYRLLEDEGVSFTEITWSVDPRRALRNWWQRRRPCLYIQGFEVPVSPARRPANGQSIGDVSMRLEDRLLMGLATQVMLPAAKTSVRLIEKLERVVQFLGVRRAFFIDDYRHAYELVVACKRCGIPTLGVQHGQFNAYSVGLMAYGFDAPQRHSFDRYWLWSPFFRDQLLRQSDLYRETDVFVGGPAQVFDEPAAPADLSARRTANTRVRVLWLAEQYESSLQRSEVTPYVARLMADPRVEVAIKLHPSQREVPLVRGLSRRRLPMPTSWLLRTAARCSKRFSTTGRSCCSPPASLATSTAWLARAQRFSQRVPTTSWNACCWPLPHRRTSCWSGGARYGAKVIRGCPRLRYGRLRVLI